MKLYHASVKELEIDRVITADRPVSFYPDVVPIYENARPDGAPSRSVCLFAADAPEKAARFMQAQGQESFHIYEVEMNEFWSGPFCITHEIYRRMKLERPIDGLIGEYWNPKRDWRFIEYFGPQLKILSEVAIPDGMAVLLVQISYEHDAKAAKDLHRPADTSARNLTN